MKLTLFFVIILAACLQMSSAQTIPLWNEQAPNSLPSSEQEKSSSQDLLWITHIQTPSLEIFLPTQQFATGQAVLICPGGGYWGLAYDWEGSDIAKWLNGHGIAAFVLKYRMPYAASVDVDHLAPLLDAQRAIRLIRSRAEEWHIDPKRVGVMGFSAGGHLASTLGTQWNKSSPFRRDSIDLENARPSFMALIYPVISMQDGVTHGGSKKNLLGENPSKKLVDQYSNELQVNKNCPPTFLLHSQDDEAVPVQNSLLMYQALVDKGVAATMHLLPKGGHGYSLGKHEYPMNQWPEWFLEWLQGL